MKRKDVVKTECDRGDRESERPEEMKRGSRGGKQRDIHVAKEGRESKRGNAGQAVAEERRGDK